MCSPTLRWQVHHSGKLGDVQTQREDYFMLAAILLRLQIETVLRDESISGITLTDLNYFAIT